MARVVVPHVGRDQEKMEFACLQQAFFRCLSFFFKKGGTYLFDWASSFGFVLAPF